MLTYIVMQNEELGRINLVKIAKVDKAYPNLAADTRLDLTKHRSIKQFSYSLVKYKTY